MTPSFFADPDDEARAELTAERNRLASAVAALAADDLAGTVSARDRYVDRFHQIFAALSARRVQLPAEPDRLPPAS